MSNMKHLLKQTVILTLLLTFPLLEIHAQITIHMKDKSASEVVKQIEKVSKYRFFYKKGLPGMNTAISVDTNDQSIETVMGQITKQISVSYTIKGETQVVLTELEFQKKATNQKKSLKGIVTDTNGEPVIGANIIEKGTTNGVISDIEGNFSMDVPEGSTLEISYIGYRPKEIKVGSKETVAVTLEEDTQSLEEIVVVGYGTQKKINMTGSVAQIDNKDLGSRPIQNLSSGIQGLMPGVTVTSQGGRPGQDGGSIRIRGVGTLNTADPYILVDGIETGTMNSVDPNDVESISVLKDAASAAIYGSKASNGVILITTKRGKTGKPRISYNGYVGIQNPTNLTERLNSYDYARLYSQVMIAEGLTPRFSEEEIQKFKNGTDPNYPNTDWYREAYKSGIQHSHNVSMSGGTENVKYMGSIGYLNQSGILPNAERQQFNGRTNLDVQLNPRLAVRMNLAYIKNDYSDPTSCYAGGGSGQIFRSLQGMAPWIVGRYPDGTYGTVSDGNPLAWLDLDQTVDRKNQNFSGVLAVDYKITDGLMATVTGSYVNDQQHYRDFQKYIRYNANKESEPNHLDERYYGWHRAAFDALLNYDKQFGQHNLKAMAGWHTEKYDYSYIKAYRKNFPTNDLTDIGAGDAASQTNEGYTRELAMVSWFGRINYDYAGKYLLEANIRSDASSRFADGNRWGYFPSFSGAWRLSEENFMESTKDWLNNLKIRASWGLLGNQDALDEYYPWMSTYNLDAKYLFGGEVNTGYYQKSYKLSTIGWEKARTWGIGLDATINNKINISFDYYDRKTTGIIMDVPVPAEFGLDAYKDNVGAMSNRGVELMVSYNNSWGDWKFGATANMAYNKNELLDLGGVNYMTDPKNEYKRREVGKRFNSYYVYKADGFFSSDADAQVFMDKYAGKDGYPFGSQKFKVGDLIYKDANGDGKITADDRVLAGSTDPTVTFSLNLNAGYKGFDLSMLFSGAAGVHRMVDGGSVGTFSGDISHPASIWLDAWTPDNQDATMPRIYYMQNSPSASYNVMSTFWIQNTSYLRMKNLQLGYTIPAKILKPIGIENLRVYYSAENLFTLDNMFFDIDPENSGTNEYPLLQTHSFGVNLTF